MKQTRFSFNIGPATLALVATVVIGSVVFAQQPGQRRQGGFPPGGQGGPGGFPGGGPGGQFQGRGFPGQGGGMPFLSGTIAGGDLDAGVINIQGPFGGNAQTVKVTSSTKVTSQKTVSVSDLAVGDQIQVQGIPASINASAITAGTPPDFMGGRGGFGGGPGFGGPGGGGQGGGLGQNRAQSQAFANANGKITSTSPLTISIGGDVSVTVKPASSAKVTKYVNAPLSSLKVGDRVMISGQPGADGSFTATNIGVNMEMGGGRGFGGFGGPGGFGPGGPGGFGPGGPGGPGGSGGPNGPDGPPPGPGGN